MPKKIPFGKRIEGRVKVGCLKCNHVWWKDVEDVVKDITGEKGEIICEVIGEKCPGCEKITSNRVLDWLPKGATQLERFFGKVG